MDSLLPSIPRSSNHRRLHMKLLTSMVATVVLLAGVCYSANGASQHALTRQEQISMTGGGYGYACYMTSSCHACSTCAGCAWWSWGNSSGCSCTSTGSDGCATTGTITLCSPRSDGSCLAGGWGAGPGGCGAPQTPDCNVVVPTNDPNFFQCQPTCVNGGSMSNAYCYSCTGTP